MNVGGEMFGKNEDNAWGQLVTACVGGRIQFNVGAG
jgi:hypothetical protein